MTSIDSIRKAGPDDAASTSATLAAAFYDDPFFRWMLPDDDHRKSALPAFFDLVVDILATHDDAWTTQDGSSGAALWVPYGREAMTAEDADRFTAEVRTLAGPYTDRMLGLFELADQHHPSEPHEYLFFVGVRPQAQGNGFGSALVGPVLARADAARHPCYLEASSPGSRRLYERHGFQATTEVTVPDGPTFWPMVRPPQS